MVLLSVAIMLGAILVYVAATAYFGDSTRQKKKEMMVKMGIEKERKTNKSWGRHYRVHGMTEDGEDNPEFSVSSFTHTKGVEEINFDESQVKDSLLPLKRKQNRATAWSSLFD